MHCETCIDQLIDYHYGELPPETMAALAAHLGSCGACALEYCRLHADLNGISAHGTVAPQPAVHVSLRQKVARTFGARPSLWARLGALARLRVPIYQPLLAMLLLGLFLLAAARVAEPGRPSARTAEPLTRGYDASEVLKLAPDVI